MKVFWGIVITLLIIGIIFLFLMNKGYKQLFMAMPKELTCGKNGNPPCTVTDLQNAGWSPEEIKTAEAASTTLQKALLCQQFGIGC